jgi:hypothetical protein
LAAKEDSTSVPELGQFTIGERLGERFQLPSSKFQIPRSKKGETGKTDLTPNLR